MPRGDRTGPMGLGSMTGRAAGYCAGYGVPGFANRMSGRGLGMRYGRGGGGRGGWMNRRFVPPVYAGFEGPYGYPPPYSPPDPKAELQILRDQATALQGELEAVNRRLSDLQADSENE